MLVPYQEEALKTSPSDFVFSGPDGAMRTSEADSQKVLPAAPVRACILDGYVHVCGVDPHRVQRIMRHRDVKLTASTYGNLIVGDPRSAVNQITGPASECIPSTYETPPEATVFSTRFLPGDSEKAEGAEFAGNSPTHSAPSSVEREKGFEGRQLVERT